MAKFATFAQEQQLAWGKATEDTLNILKEGSTMNVYEALYVTLDEDGAYNEAGDSTIKIVASSKESARDKAIVRFLSDTPVGEIGTDWDVLIRPFL